MNSQVKKDQWKSTLSFVNTWRNEIEMWNLSWIIYDKSLLGKPLRGSNNVHEGKKCEYCN